MAAGVVAQRLRASARASLDAIPDISDPQIVVYVKWPRSPQLLETEVTEPLDQRAGRLAGHPVDPRHLAHGLLVHLRHPRPDGAGATTCSSWSLDRINAIRPQLPADAIVTLGPERQQHGLDLPVRAGRSRGLHDLRELRLLNESQIKPALQTVPGVAEVASVGGLEKQYQIKIFPPLLAKAGIPLQAGHRRASRVCFRKPAAG